MARTSTPRTTSPATEPVHESMIGGFTAEQLAALQQLLAGSAGIPAPTTAAKAKTAAKAQEPVRTYTDRTGKERTMSGVDQPATYGQVAALANLIVEQDPDLLLVAFNTAVPGIALTSLTKGDASDALQAATDAGLLKPRVGRNGGRS